MEPKNKFYTTDYDISTPYYKGDIPKRIMVASDIHYQPSVNRDTFRLLVKYAQESKPDYIVMPGDQVETIDFIGDINNKEFFESIIRGLAEVAPVIMIPVNHEIKDFSPKNFKNRLDTSNNDVNTRALNYLDSLNRINNVYFLNNDQVTLKGANFLGFSPRLSSYQKINDEKTVEEFIDDFYKSGIKMTEDEYNILLTHSPQQLTNETVLENIDFNNTDLAISGHFHDGYLPKILDKPLGNTNVGLFFTPLVAPYPGIICRGAHDFGRGYLVVSQGFRKWTADMAIFNLLEKDTSNDVDNVIVSNGEKSVSESSSHKAYTKQKQYRTNNHK